MPDEPFENLILLPLCKIKRGDGFGPDFCKESIGDFARGQSLAHKTAPNSQIQGKIRASYTVEGLRFDQSRLGWPESK